MLASSSFALVIRQYLEQLKSLESSIAAFDDEIARLMDNFDTKLETITGVGTTLAAVIFSEINGDIKKFFSVPKLVAYAGLYPKSRQSGESKMPVTCLNVVHPICVALFDLSLTLLLSKTLLSVSFIRRNVLKAKNI